MWTIFKLLISLTLVHWNQAAKILGVFPIPSISHQVVFRPVMIELAKRGHEVTVITPDPAFPNGKSPANFTEIDVHDISYALWRKFIEEHGNISDQIKLMTLIPGLMLRVFEEQLKSTEVQKLMKDKNKKYDLVFVESAGKTALYFSYLYKVPVISFSSLSGIFGNFEMVGAATHPLVYPNPLHQRIFNLTLWEKITELRLHYKSEHLLLCEESRQKEILKKYFGPDIPDLSELEKTVHMLFLNVHPIWDFNRPVPPNVVYLGGLHQKEEKPLPQELKSYLDSSKHGVIYVSFGTNVRPSLFPPEKLRMFVTVFGKLKYDILFKWEKDELPGRSSNVKISKWLPQSDLLRHPNVKLFITQGGLQSTDEAITAGVPLVAIPMLGDQWFNAEQYEHLNIGKKLLMEILTEEKLMNAIQTVIEDKSYRENIVKLRNIMHDQPQTPLERAVWWTEYVIRHGGALHLRTPAAFMHWTEYYELNLILTVTAVIVIVKTIVMVTLYNFISKFRSVKTKLKKRHPNVKLFITQGGLQSTDEAITAGVPLVGIPMLGDQWFNAEQYEHLNIGKKLLMEILTEEKLMNAIQTVIEDKSYRENIVKLRNIMHDQPETPLERAVWWTEYVIRHGGALHLRTPAAFMHWTEYYELNLILTVTAVIVIVKTIVMVTLYNFISKFRSGKTKLKKS